MYFVPSGRVGFKRPNEIAPWSNVWALLSADHTFDVRITEMPRLDPDSDSYLWDKDDRSELIQTDIKVPGFEIRRFRDKRYDPSVDYSAQSVILRDREWMGNIEVSTGNLGSPISVPGGQIARWRAIAEGVLSSIVVRPALPVKAALDELHASLDTEGLNPRFAGEKLILSLYTPRNNLESWGANHPVIRVEGLPFIPPGLTTDDRASLASESFDIMRQDPGYQPIDDAPTRGLISPELEYIPGFFSREIQAYSKTRQVKLTAFYKAEERAVLVEAFRHAHRNFVINEWPLP